MKQKNYIFVDVIKILLKDKHYKHLQYFLKKTFKYNLLQDIF